MALLLSLLLKSVVELAFASTAATELALPSAAATLTLLRGLALRSGGDAAALAARWDVAGLGGR